MVAGFYHIKTHYQRCFKNMATELTLGLFEQFEGDKKGRIKNILLETIEEDKTTQILASITHSYVEIMKFQI